MSIKSYLGDVPRHITHPPNTVDWTDTARSFRINSGCERGIDCAGATSAPIPPGPLYECWGPMRLPVAPPDQQGQPLCGVGGSGRSREERLGSSSPSSSSSGCVKLSIGAEPEF